jgi:hypothetical protein
MTAVSAVPDGPGDAAVHVEQLGIEKPILLSSTGTNAITGVRTW